MRIHKIHIRNFRGIRDFETEFRRSGALFYGPNGAGKSSVLQSIEFLLTGCVRDLEGSGTGRQDPEKHIRHRGVDPSESWVTATFLDGGEEIKIKRTVGNSDQLEIVSDHSTLPSKLKTQQTAMRLSQNRLSRDEVLDFVTTSPGSRGDALNEILRVQNTEDKRKAFAKAVSDQKSQIDSLQDDLKKQRDDFYDALEDTVSNKTDNQVMVDADSDALEVINTLRSEYEVSSLSELDEKEFTAGITKPTSYSRTHPLDRGDLRSEFEVLEEWFSWEGEMALADRQKLRDKLEEFEQNSELRRDVRAQNLLEQGEELLTEFEPDCPLCLYTWDDATELRERIEKRQDSASHAEELRGEIDDLRDEQLERIKEVQNAANTLIKVFEDEDPESYPQPIAQWTRELGTIEAELREYRKQLEAGDVLEVPFPSLGREELTAKLLTADLEEAVVEMKAQWESEQEGNEGMSSYRVLAVAYDRFSRYSEIQEDIKKAEEVLSTLETVNNEFRTARQRHYDRTLEKIRERFEEIYCDLHTDEEVKDFSADLKSTDHGVKFRTSFRDSDTHRPNLVYSEGHQDSMGLALFLAMCEVVGGEELEFLLLDDVVTSIDAAHRSAIANLLGNDIGGDFQLIMTTHDKVWARRLRTTKYIQNTIHFADCKFQAGVHHSEDIANPWGMIDYYLDRNEITAAAAWGRKTAEWFCSKGCEQFGAELPYGNRENLGLQDYFDGIVGELEFLLERGDVDDETIFGESELSDTDEMVGNLRRLKNEHIWGLNENIHYNEEFEASYSPDDLREDIAVFDQLYNVLHCPNCNNWRQHGRDGVYCSCGTIWKT
ncbi:AAA domain-containing protein [Natrinema hispanicum]|uniref:AAA domain-containing protein n=1 Tax=Natrinema hispanicum TaxID=392421 RepID=A0A482YCE5_9EURY|nr:AAA family ATPase [Natrinema hispanicum]RZV10489.1 AAA domain-containing protein [Natrinema hispanicum]